MVSVLERFAATDDEFVASGGLRRLPLGVGPEVARRTGRELDFSRFAFHTSDDCLPVGDAQDADQNRSDYANQPKRVGVDIEEAIDNQENGEHRAGCYDSQNNLPDGKHFEPPSCSLRLRPKGIKEVHNALPLRRISDLDTPTSKIETTDTPLIAPSHVSSAMLTT